VFFTSIWELKKVEQYLAGYRYITRRCASTSFHNPPLLCSSLSATFALSSPAPHSSSHSTPDFLWPNWEPLLTGGPIVVPRRIDRAYRSGIFSNFLLSAFLSLEHFWSRFSLLQ